MPLLLGFNREEALSIVAPAMFDLADRLSECPGFQRLADGAAAEEAREKIHINTVWDPFDQEIEQAGGETITEASLEAILLRANIRLRTREPYEASEPQAVAAGEGNCPDEIFTLEIECQRHIRKAEIEAAGEDSVMLDVTDCATSIVHKLHEVANRKAQIIGNVRLSQAPLWNDIATQSGQGKFIFWFYEVDIGDTGGDE